MLPFAASASAPNAPDTAPVPVSATWTPTAGIWQCTFDKPLLPGVKTAGNWGMRVLDHLWAAASASVPVANPTRVTGLSFEGPPLPGANSIAYVATPPDIIGVNGLPVAPFEIDLTIV